MSGLNEKHPKSQLYEILSINKDFLVESIKFEQISQQQFRCIVLIKHNYDDKKYIFQSDIYSNKKDSERDSFDKALTYVSSVIAELNQSNATNHYLNFDFDLNFNFDEYDELIIIVDYENISRKSEMIRLGKMVQELSKIKTQFKTSIIKVSGFCSSNKDDCDIVVRSNRKDAVDHYISYYIGRLELEAETNKIKRLIYVMTRDKFGLCIQDFAKNVTHVADVNDLINILIKS